MDDTRAFCRSLPINDKRRFYQLALIELQIYSVIICIALLVVRHLLLIMLFYVFTFLDLIHIWLI